MKACGLIIHGNQQQKAPVSPENTGCEEGMCEDAAWNRMTNLEQGDTHTQQAFVQTRNPAETTAVLRQAPSHQWEPGPRACDRPVCSLKSTVLAHFSALLDRPLLRKRGGKASLKAAGKRQAPQSEERGPSPAEQTRRTQTAAGPPLVVRLCRCAIIQRS